MRTRGLLILFVAVSSYFPVVAYAGCDVRQQGDDKAHSLSDPHAATCTKTHIEPVHKHQYPHRSYPTVFTNANGGVQTVYWVPPVFITPNPQNVNEQELVVPPKVVIQEGDDYCREYTRALSINGRVVRGYGTACRQSNGTWLAVN